MSSVNRENRKHLAFRFFGVLCAFGISTVAQAKNAATPTSYVGWAWSDQLNPTSCYAPPAPWSYNSQGGAITICPVVAEPGTYDVTFSNLWSGGKDNVQVVSYDANPWYGGHICSVGKWWQSGSDITAEVDCSYPRYGYFHPGAGWFTVFYQARTSGFGNSSDGIAYLFDDQPAWPSYSPGLQYNSMGGFNTIVRGGTGYTTVTIPGLQAAFGDVQVTESLGPNGQLGQCKVVGWGYAPSGGTNVNVQCFDNSGNAADREYSLAYAVNAPFGLTTPTHSDGAWAWANQPGTTTVYTPSVFYQYNGFQTGNLTAQKLSTGEYAVYLPGNLNYSTSTALVTAYGSGNNLCDVDEWNSSVLYVDCWAENGSAADSMFDVALQTAE